jgi:hypothetical protein
MRRQIVFKHPLRDNINVLTLARGASVLSVQEQNGVLCLWEQHSIDDEDEIEVRTFVIVGTGHPFDPRGLIWIATVQVSGGAFVWHIYERGEPVAVSYPQPAKETQP